MKRYTVQLDAYIHTDNDEQAKIKAARLQKALQQINDSIEVNQISETPFACRDSRLIHRGRIDNI